MHNELLIKFFKENKLASETPTPPALAHFYIKLDGNPKAHDKIEELINPDIYESQPERVTDIETEKNEIASADAIRLSKLMRRAVDPLNQTLLINKALSVENEIVPDIVKRLKTSLNSGYIELAIRILAQSSIDVTEDLFGYYEDMRNPYGQSLVQVLLGFKAEETRIPWFIEQYKTLIKMYPKEYYSDGAFYALCEMQSRFYPE